MATGLRRLPYDERLRRLDLYSLACHDRTFNVFTGLFDADPSAIFLPPIRAQPPPVERVGLFGGGFQVLK